MRFAKPIAIAVPLALWALTLAGVVHAAQVYQGSDVTGGSDANRRVYVCDHEADGHGVHADAYSFYDDYVRVDDENGSASPCYESPRMLGGLKQHRTVEEINNLPDYYSDWSYH